MEEAWKNVRTSIKNTSIPRPRLFRANINNTSDENGHPMRTLSRSISEYVVASARKLPPLPSLPPSPPPISSCWPSNANSHQPLQSSDSSSSSSSSFDTRFSTSSSPDSSAYSYGMPPPMRHSFGHHRRSCNNTNPEVTAASFASGGFRPSTYGTVSVCAFIPSLCNQDGRFISHSILSDHLLKNTSCRLAQNTIPILE